MYVIMILAWYLSEHRTKKLAATVPEQFGDLHGKLFQYVLNTEAYTTNFNKAPVICLSVSTTKTYSRQMCTLGVEYKQVFTYEYFHKNGLTGTLFHA